MHIRKRLVALSLVLVLFSGVALLGLADENVLTVVMEADQYANYVAILAEQFEEATGIDVELEILGYVEHRQKITQDFATDTKQYDVVAVDIVWVGEFEQKGWTVDLTPFIERDYVEIDVPDIMPVCWTMGEWNDRVIAYPMSGYNMSLIYRTDLFNDPDEKADFLAEYGYELTVPQTIAQLTDAAEFFTRPNENLYGLSAAGARGVVAAQEYMTYLKMFGGKILDDSGNVTLDDPIAVDALEFFVRMFDEWGLPGAAGYWWSDREGAYRLGKLAMQMTWSIARPGYDIEGLSNVIGMTGMALPPVQPGTDNVFAFGGWGVGINADISPEKQEMAWEFIKFITTPEAAKGWMMTPGTDYGTAGDTGLPIRLSTLLDPDLNAQFPYMSTLLTGFIQGDGDFRPRVPDYAQIESIMGLYVSMAITHELTPAEALGQAAAEIRAIYNQ